MNLRLALKWTLSQQNSLIHSKNNNFNDASNLHFFFGFVGAWSFLDWYTVQVNEKFTFNRYKITNEQNRKKTPLSNFHK